jgi:hypothetical protein
MYVVILHKETSPLMAASMWAFVLFVSTRQVHTPTLVFVLLPHQLSHHSHS